jgi:2-hydroxy-3-keto-5-methylthiopentenyl-1-phosphate phosphatase
MTEPAFNCSPVAAPARVPAQVPRPDEAQVWIDFDGTLSRRDVLDDLIRTYSVNESWKLVEEQWQAGLIGSKQCLERQLALVEISDEELNDFLDGVDLDAGAVPLLKLLNKHKVPVAVLSDGIDWFIKRVLLRHGIKNLEVRSNTVVRNDRKIELQCPHHVTQCKSGSAHCKCGSAKALGEVTRGSIYIGDGRSDLCAARESEIVFAKNALAKFLTQEGREFRTFDTLSDVRNVLATAWHDAKPSRRLAITSG